MKTLAIMGFLLLCSTTVEAQTADIKPSGTANTAAVKTRPILPPSNWWELEYWQCDPLSCESAL